MKTKLILRQKKKSEKTFIIFPRWCGRCMLGYFLQFVPTNNDAPACPVHKTYLWNDKESAFRVRNR